MVDQAALDNFIDALNRAKAAHMGANFPNLTPVTYKVKVGKKFAKVTESNRGGVFCFIDMATGDLLKAASFNAPAKGTRGHISNGARDVTPYGCTYNNGCEYATYGDMGIA